MKTLSIASSAASPTIASTSSTSICCLPCVYKTSFQARPESGAIGTQPIHKRLLCLRVMVIPPVSRCRERDCRGHGIHPASRQWLRQCSISRRACGGHRPGEDCRLRPAGSPQAALFNEWLQHLRGTRRLARVSTIFGPPNIGSVWISVSRRSGWASRSASSMRRISPEAVLPRRAAAPRYALARRQAGIAAVDQMA